MSGELTVLRMGYYPRRRVNHKLTNDTEIWKGNQNTTKLLFYLKGLNILHQERRGQVKTMLMEHFNSILFHMSGSANKQHTNHLWFFYIIQKNFCMGHNLNPDLHPSIYAPTNVLLRHKCSHSIVCVFYIIITLWIHSLWLMYSGPWNIFIKGYYSNKTGTKIILWDLISICFIYLTQIE